MFSAVEETYRKGILSIESQTGFVIPESDISAFTERLNTIRNEADEINLEINRTIARASNYCPLPFVSLSTINEVTDDSQQKSKELIQDVNSVECQTMSRLEDLEKYVAAFESCINGIGVGSWGDINHYEPGSFAKNGFAEQMESLYLLQHLIDKRSVAGTEHLDY